MSQNFDKNGSHPSCNSESFRDDQGFMNSRSPLLPVQNVPESPDVAQKKLLGENRKLSMKINELQSLIDDLESDKRELIQTNIDCEKKISSLEEKCRFKDRELVELRELCGDLETLRLDNESMKTLISRLETSLKSEQELSHMVPYLEKDNEVLVQENTTFQNKIKALEVEVAQLRIEQDYKIKYEQAKEALERAEKELFEAVKESERSRALAEVEALRWRSNTSQTLTWMNFSCGRCTCSCHHNLHQIVEDSPNQFKSELHGNTSPSLTDTSVIDVSLWRDNRNAFAIEANKSEVGGECLGEVMAQDAKVQELKAQLYEARSEASRAIEELTSMSEQHAKLKEQYENDRKEWTMKATNAITELDDFKRELYLLSTPQNSPTSMTAIEATNLKAPISGLDAEKQSSFGDLKLKTSDLEKVMAELLNISSGLGDVTNESMDLRLQNNELQVELRKVNECLNSVKLERDSAKAEVDCFRDKVKVLEAEKTTLSERLSTFEKDLKTIQDSHVIVVAGLQSEISSLTMCLQESGGKLSSVEETRIGLEERVHVLQKETEALKSEKETLKARLEQSLKSVNELDDKLKEALSNLGDELRLVEHLKSDRQDLKKDRDEARKELDEVKKNLSQALGEVAQLREELEYRNVVTMQVERLESSLLHRDSDITSLNQMICTNEAAITRLNEERNFLSSKLNALTVDLEVKVSNYEALLEEHNKVEKVKDELLSRVEFLESEITNYKQMNQTLERELRDCQGQLVIIQDQVEHLTVTNRSLIDENAKLVGEKTSLKEALTEESNSVVQLRDEIAALSEKVLSLGANVEHLKHELADLDKEKALVCEELRSRTLQSVALESQVNGLQAELTAAKTESDRLLKANAQLSESVSALEVELKEAALSSQGQYKEASHMLEERLKRLRAEVLVAEQSSAEARQAASVAIMHRQVAENEASRLSDLVKALERRLDFATSERLACEERATSVTIRCRQMEGLVNEKETIIKGLEHQLSQLEAQRKSAQENEASTLREYLRSKAAQDEAERRLALLTSRSTLAGTTDLKQSYRSLDCFPAPPLPQVPKSTEFNEPFPARRRHSDGKPTPRRDQNKRAVEGFPKEDKPHVDLDKGDTETQRGIVFDKLAPEEALGLNKSPVFADGICLSPEDLIFDTPKGSVASHQTRIEDLSRSGLQELTFVSCLEGVEVDENADLQPTHPSLSTIRYGGNESVGKCTPVITEEAASPIKSLSRTTHHVPVVKCQESELNHIMAVASAKPLQVARTVEAPRPDSAASHVVTSTDTESVSELENWPPYDGYAAPLSPHALRGGKTFTVPTPFEFHFHRLQRLLIAPCAVEDDDLIETKTIGPKNAYPIVVSQSANEHHADAESGGTFRVKDPKVFHRVANLPPRLPGDKPQVLLRSEYNFSVEDLTIKAAASTKNTDERWSAYGDHASVSVPPAAKLARFRSVQELSAAVGAEGEAEAGARQASSNANTLRRRFKNRFARGKRTAASHDRAEMQSESTSINDAASERTRNSSVSSGVTKKHPKLRLSNVFRSKKRKPW